MFLTLVFGVVQISIGQVLDSSLNVTREKSKLLEEINEKKQQDVKKNIEYEMSVLPSKQIFEMQKRMIIINETQQKAIHIDESEQKAIYRDESEDGTNKKEMSMEFDIIDESEKNANKRLITGPSQFDSRIEVRNLSPLIHWQEYIIENARSVGVIIEKEMIHQVTDSIYQLDISSTLGSLYNLCPGEAFYEQPVVGVGTAFIIDNQTMVTASHVFTGPLENYVAVFGFEMVNKMGAYEAFISANDIYYPQKVRYNSDDMDVTAFIVDRPFDRPNLKWSNSFIIPNKASVYMIGHPMGLPKKAALNASILNNEDPFFFYTSLDAFQGNSGSPVFRLDTNEVIGILVSGELDFKWNGNCNASTLCGFPYCKGEKVIRIENIINDLN